MKTSMQSDGTGTRQGGLVVSLLRGRRTLSFVAGGVGGSVVTIVALHIFGYGCGPSTGSQAAAASETPIVTAKAPAAPSDSPVKLEAKQAGEIATQVLHPEASPQRLTINGKISFNEDKTSLILAPLAGRVEGLKVRVGDRVAKGDTLFQLKGRDVAVAQSDYLESRKDVELAEKTSAMTKDLFAHQAASTIALQQAENDLAKARTRLSRTQEQLRVLGLDPAEVENGAQMDARISIRSPIDGVVVERHVTDGQLVQGDGTALITVADLSSVWVLADVFERDLHLVHVGEEAEVATLAWPDAKFNASVAYISNVVDPQTRTVKVRLLTPNPDLRLRPDMFASVNVVVGRTEQALLIPSRSVLDDNGSRSVFVRVGEGAYSPKRVELRPATDGRWLVLAGLQAGDEVVTSGAILLRQIMLQGGDADADNG